MKFVNKVLLPFSYFIGIAFFIMMIFLSIYYGNIEVNYINTKAEYVSKSGPVKIDKNDKTVKGYKYNYEYIVNEKRYTFSLTSEYDSKKEIDIKYNPLNPEQTFKGYALTMGIIYFTLGISSLAMLLIFGIDVIFKPKRLKYYLEIINKYHNKKICVMLFKASIIVFLSSTYSTVVICLKNMKTVKEIDTSLLVIFTILSIISLIVLIICISKIKKLSLEKNKKKKGKKK